MNLEELPPHEQSLYRLIGLGKSDAEIATTLGLPKPRATRAVQLFLIARNYTRIGIIFEFTNAHFCDEEIPASEFARAFHAIRSLNREYRRPLAEYVRQWCNFAMSPQKYTLPPTIKTVALALGQSETEVQADFKKVYIRLGASHIYKMFRAYYLNILWVPEVLSYTQGQIFLLIREGYSNQAIGERQGLSVHSTNAMAAQVYKKLDTCRMKIVFDYIDANSPSSLIPLTEFAAAYSYVASLDEQLQQIAAIYTRQWQQYISRGDYGSKAPSRQTVADELRVSMGTVAAWLLRNGSSLYELARLQYMANLYPIITLSDT